MATKSMLNEQLKQEQHRKEDRAFYTLIIAFAVGLIIEVALISLYRAYFAGENYRPTLRIVQWAFLGITALSAITFIYSAITKKFNYLMPLVGIGGTFFLLAVILRLTNVLGTIALQVSTTVFPIIVLLFAIYKIYQTEFFMSSLFGALGIFTMWYTRKVFYMHYHQRLFVMLGVVALVIILAALTFTAMKNKGCIGGGALHLRLFAPKTSYKSLYITYGVTLGLFLVYLLLEWIFYPLIIPIIIGFAAYVFITAIYYTIKLM